MDGTQSFDTIRITTYTCVINFTTSPTGLAFGPWSLYGGVFIHSLMFLLLIARLLQEVGMLGP